MRYYWDDHPYDFQYTQNEAALLEGALFTPEIKTLLRDPNEIGPATRAFTVVARRLTAEAAALRAGMQVQYERDLFRATYGDGEIVDLDEPRKLKK